MPRRVRACVGIASKSIPSKFTVPLDALRRPIRLFMSVVLPAPFRPISPAMLPLGSSSETSRRICTASIATLSVSILSTGRQLLLAMELSADHVTPNVNVAEHGFGPAVGDDPAVVEREHALGKAAYDFHVVLDEDHRDALGFHRFHHHLHDAELFFGRDAARGLVEQENPGPRGHGERDIEELAHASGQHLRVLFAILGEAEALENALGDLLGRRVVPRHGRARAGSGEEPAPAGVVQHDAQGRQHVLVDAERAVELRDLERAENPQARDVARRERRDIASLVADVARIGLEIARDHVDEGRLSRAVGADQPDDRVRLDRRVDVRRRRDRAETLVHAASAPPMPASVAAITYLTWIAWRADAPMYSTRISLSLIAGARRPSGVPRKR